MTDNRPRVESIFDDSGPWAALEDVSTLGDTEASGGTSWYGWGVATPKARSEAGKSVGAGKTARSRPTVGAKAASRGAGGGTRGETADLASPSPSSAIVDLDEMTFALDEARRKIDQIDSAQRDSAARSVAQRVGGTGAAESPSDGNQRPASTPSTPRIGLRDRVDYGSAPLGAFGLPSAGVRLPADSGAGPRRSTNASPDAPTHPPPGLEDDMGVGSGPVSGPEGGLEEGDMDNDAAGDGAPPAAARAAAAWLRHSHPRYAQRLELQLLQRDEAAREAEVEASLQEVSRLRLRLRSLEREVLARNGGVRSLTRENRELSEQILTQSAQLDAMRARISALHQQAMARHRNPSADRAAPSSGGGAKEANGADRNSNGRDGEADKGKSSASPGRTPPQRAQGTRMATIAHTALAARAASLRLQLARRRTDAKALRNSPFGVVSGTLPRGTAPTTVEQEGAQAVNSLCRSIAARRMMLLDAVRRHAKADPKALTRDEFMALFSEFDALPKDAAERAVVWKQVAGGKKELSTARLRDIVLSFKSEQLGKGRSPSKEGKTQARSTRKGSRRASVASEAEGASSPLRVVPGTLPASKEAVDLTPQGEEALTALCRALEEKRLRLRDLFGTEVGLGREAFQKAFAGAGLGPVELATVWRLASRGGERTARYVPLRDAIWSLKGYAAGTHSRPSPGAASGVHRPSVLLRQTDPLSIVPGKLPLGRDAVDVPPQLVESIVEFSAAVIWRHLRLADLFKDGPTMNREAYELLLERLGLGDWTQETCSEVWRQFCAAYSSRVERSRADVPGADVGTKASPAAPFGPASDGTSGASDVSGDTSDDENTEEVFDIEAVREVILSVKHRRREEMRALTEAGDAEEQSPPTTPHDADMVMIPAPQAEGDGGAGDEGERGERKGNLQGDEERGEEAQSPRVVPAASAAQANGPELDPVPGCTETGAEPSSPSLDPGASTDDIDKSRSPSRHRQQSPSSNSPQVSPRLHADPRPRQRASSGSLLLGAAHLRDPHQRQPRLSVPTLAAAATNTAASSRSPSPPRPSPSSPPSPRARRPSQRASRQLMPSAAPHHARGGAAGAAAAAAAAAAAGHVERLTEERDNAVSKVNELVDDLEAALNAEELARRRGDELAAQMNAMLAEAQSREAETEESLSRAQEKARGLEYALESLHTELRVTEDENKEGKAHAAELARELAEARGAAERLEARLEQEATAREAAERRLDSAGHGCCVVQ